MTCSIHRAVIGKMASVSVCVKLCVCGIERESVCVCCVRVCVREQEGGREGGEQGRRGGAREKVRVRACVCVCVFVCAECACMSVYVACEHTDRYILHLRRYLLC